MLEQDVGFELEEQAAKAPSVSGDSPPGGAEEEMFDATDSNDPNFGLHLEAAMAAMMEAEMLDAMLNDSCLNDSCLYD